jgi:hypothetical protein
MMVRRLGIMAIMITMLVITNTLLLHSSETTYDFIPDLS